MLQFQNMIYTIYYFDLDVEEKVEVPESDENVVNDDLSDLDRWGCRDIVTTPLCRAFKADNHYWCNRGNSYRIWSVCRKTCGLC